MAENLMTVVVQKHEFKMFCNGMVLPDYVVRLQMSTTGSGSKPKFYFVVQGGESIILF